MTPDTVAQLRVYVIYYKIINRNRPPRGVLPSWENVWETQKLAPERGKL
jgi:hypothetical protein